MWRAGVTESQRLRYRAMPAGLYFRHASSLQHETGAHPENKARIPAIEHELARRGWVGWEAREAPAVETAQLERIHPAEHIEHIRDTSAGGGGWFDADTVASAGSWTAALHAARGARARGCWVVKGGGAAPVGGPPPA